MQSYMFIAEKPSLMRDVQACYKNHKKEINSKVGLIDFVALSGHVCENFEPSDYSEWADQKWADIDYPMVPSPWKIKPIDDARKRSTINKIKKDIGNYDGVIVGTDSDVEGYGIYYMLEHYLHIEKVPALRFMEHSLTDGEILKSLLSMTDYHTDPKHVRFTQSFLLRSRSDWLYGMNATRMMTVKRGVITTIGRVKAPTIRLVYDNSMAIENFKPETFYQAVADYGSFTAALTDQAGKTVRYSSEDDIPDFPLNGTVSQKTAKRRKTHAPKLFDLASIQKEAGAKFGYKPKQTLDIIQDLYEKHKVISYPRTQCCFVSEEKAREFPEMVKAMSVFSELKGPSSAVDAGAYARVMKDKNVVNDKEVQKESHDALLPTGELPDLSSMSADEKNICLMIFTRLLAQLLPMYEEDRTVLVIQHGNGLFRAEGKVPVVQGWRQLYSEAKENALPDLNEGDELAAEEIQHKKGQTKPPKRLTQHGLIDAMQNIASQIADPKLKKSLADSKGIGTPATRASIISDILARGYVQDRKDGLYITEAGKGYIRSVSPLDISSPVFAAEMDTGIKRIQRGEEEFMTGYKNMLTGLRTMCQQIEGIVPDRPKANAFCPVCGQQLEITRYCYSCPKDGFKVQRAVCGVSIDEKMLNDLLAGRKTPQMTFIKKDGTQFRSALVMKDGKLAFSSYSDIPCPKCGQKKIRINKGGAFCDSCDFKLFRKMADHMFTDRELERLMTKGKVKNIEFTSRRTGNSFTADVALDDNCETKFVFADSKKKRKKKIKEGK